MNKKAFQNPIVSAIFAVFLIVAIFSLTSVDTSYAGATDGFDTSFENPESEGELTPDSSATEANIEPTDLSRQGSTQPVPITFQNPLKVDTFRELLELILSAIVTIAFPFIVLAIIYTGFLFIKAQGKPTELEKAKQALFWVLIGSLLILGAWTLSKAIEGTVDQLRAEIPAPPMYG